MHSNLACVFVFVCERVCAQFFFCMDLTAMCLKWRQRQSKERIEGQSMLLKIYLSITHNSKIFFFLQFVVCGFIPSLWGAM